MKGGLTNGEGAYCLAGACILACTGGSGPIPREDPRYALYREVIDAILPGGALLWNATRWNDDPGRTFDDVKAAIKRAREKLCDVCANCGKRPGTVEWGDALASTHGWTVKWCEHCVLEAQIAHAEERARALPELRERLASLRTQDA